MNLLQQLFRLLTEKIHAVKIAQTGFMPKTFRYISTIWLLFNALTLNSQDLGVQLLCSPRPDSILLRWAPVNPQTWRLANEYGYIVERYTLLKNKELIEEVPMTRLTGEALKPKPLNEWEKYADDKYVSIAAESIFGSFLQDMPAAGNPHFVYKKYQEENHRFSFALYSADQSPAVARLSGLFLADKSAKPDEKYLYKVYINSPDSIAVDTAFAFTGISEYHPLPEPLDLHAEWEDKKVSLSWNRKYHNHIYNSYIVEKSTDGGLTYSTIGENAIVQLSDQDANPDIMYKTDQLADNESEYYYRVRGISAFGETGPPSEPVSGKGRLTITRAPQIYGNDVIDNKFVRLSWEYPVEMNDYISGFKVYRSTHPDGKKNLIYSGEEPGQRELVDSTPCYTNYYLVSVYSQLIEKVSPNITYAEIVDSIPPLPPQFYKGTIDTTGRVILTWLHNSEDDLSGYRVYWANTPDYEFMLAVPHIITDSVFVDSVNLKTLTRNIYYKIKAVDVRDNQSAFSELIEIERPDIIPPVSPVLQNIETANGFPELTWINSSSQDVAFHHIYRKEVSDTSFLLLKSIGKTEEGTSVFSDFSPEKGREYIYYIVAEDEGGLKSSPSNQGYIRISSGIVESIYLIMEEFTDHVNLSWSVNSEKELERVVIYRSIDNGMMRIHGNSVLDNFTDDKLSPEKTYRYAIRAIYKDGGSSSLSNTVIVKL